MASASATARALDRLDHYLDRHPELGKSLYDRHTDGSGVLYSSALRPIVSLRPRYRYWVAEAPRHLAADFCLLAWLEEGGFAYDLITNHDLNARGAALLEPYEVVITRTHPEY